MASTDEHITKIKSLHKQGFKKDNLNDKKGREKKKKNGKLKIIEKGNEKVKGSMNEKGNKKVKGLIIIICTQYAFNFSTLSRLFFYFSIKMTLLFQWKSH